MKQTLGTQLRHLIELLDGAVSAAYKEAGLDYRPRYTPVMRALTTCESMSIGELAELAGITQPAATQTIALMKKEGLVCINAGASDGRQKMVSLSEQGRAMIPALTACWQATAMAASSLEADVTIPLGPALNAAITALNTKSYGTRISEARAELSSTPPSEKP
jgi:DNA-binding MarR family transcriptional regulator